MKLELRLKQLFSKTKRNFDLPEDYVVSKFYELGYKVYHNKWLNVYQSCCPICHEGKSWGRKKRCYYIPENKNIFCHNCGASHTPYNWIREVSGMSDAELWEDFNKGCYDYLEVDSGPKEKPKQPKQPTLPEDCINLFDPNQIRYYIDNTIVQYAWNYVQARRLNTAINRPHAVYISLKDYVHGNRLVIPFKEESDQIVFYQSRKIFDKDERESYISKIDSEKTIYGIERVTPDIDTVFLFEGPIDASFIKNGLAVAGITKGVQKFTQKQEDQLESVRFFDKIWFLDSQWLDETSRIKTEMLLKMGEKVFIWPESYGKKFKDLNEMCVHHGLDQISPKFVKKNSISGENAVLKFKSMMNKL